MNGDPSVLIKIAVLLTAITGLIKAIWPNGIVF